VRTRELLPCGQQGGTRDEEGGYLGADRETAAQVKAWEEMVVIPTYPTPPPDRNPMFLEKRVYQGSSGKVYPNPFTDRVSSERSERDYRAVFLENDYIKVMILPELGGRIHRGLDKTNQYDFFYYQKIIKPALVGLLGPWMSGGVEFNWPQHHRPSTFMPVTSVIERHTDGSATVWLSEHEPMNRMKGMVGLRLYPGKSMVEALVQIYNRTPFVQSFLWWANAAVEVHDQYQAFFPPDVTWVADHAKRATTEFPIARSVYYGVDYTSGADLRWYGNIPVPMSYMVTESRYDFFGGYDHLRQAGMVHVADHHISPGKKLWTWGCGEFGKAWDQELTDSGAPYFELMAGVYTNNQPDFSWLHPFETRTFSQCWYPIQVIGPAKNANRHAAINLEITAADANVGVCVTEHYPGATVKLRSGATAWLDRTADLVPGKPLQATVCLPAGVNETDLLLSVLDSAGCELISYRPEKLEESPLPGPAKEPPPPEKIQSIEGLFIIGLHLEQYRHATRSPESYWEEALRRDPGDARSNNALGLVRLRRGKFEEAELHFRRAVVRLTERNPNPFDGEPYYNLGLALKFQQRCAEAYGSFQKATWNHAWQSASHYALAEIDCSRKDYASALEHLRCSLEANVRNQKARNLKAAVLRHLGRNVEAQNVALESVELDPLDFWSRNEIVLALRARGDPNAAEKMLRELSALMQDEVQTYLDIAFDYAGAGLFEEAIDVLKRLLGRVGYPMLFYALGFFYQQICQTKRAAEFYDRGSQALPDYCFPAQLQEMLILENVLQTVPNDSKACYYLGNLLYDKKRNEEAIQNWERSSKLDAGFSIAWRNLGMAYCNVRHDPEKAAACYSQAFAANPGDARILYEMDQLDKRRGIPPEERLAALEKEAGLVAERDDLTVELVTLYNEVGNSRRALEILLARRFHPWEGGEGLVSAQYVAAHVILGRESLEAARPRAALDHFDAARRYPANLGEGKHLLTPENHLHYFAGLARKALGDVSGSQQAFEQAVAIRPGLSPMMYYRALAERELGHEEAASRLLHELSDLALRQLTAEVKVDYFATSLPNFLLFEDDLQKRNRVDSLYLIGLAHAGLGETIDAENRFREVLSLDVNHLGVRMEIRWLRSVGTAK
jgi:tetratricopeptide (TPR) repeat protein